MARFLAGVASALLLVTAGFFLWTGLARHDPTLPPPPPVVAALTGSSLAASAPTVADAPQATEKTREEKRFDRYDHNKDGRIDRDEYLLARHKNFAKLDTNGDGKLSFDEYAAKAIGKFSTADADHSGTLDRVEFATTKVLRKSKPRCAPGSGAAKSPPPTSDDNEEGQQAG
jgi:hypothetical protein